jgi:2-keto-4-pentenoate hydratase/2-oxohepta-3-ene-1,7-dioic acid hydratase in catechol pathway
MKLLRFKTGNIEKKGIYEDGVIKRIFGSVFHEYTVTDEVYNFDEVQILPPVLPSKIVCVGRNYSDHAKELGNSVPDEPMLFLKPSTALNSHESVIIYPEVSKRVDFEAELGVVIGKKCKSVSAQNALDYVLGYTCFNDITARDIQKKENKFTRAKSFDSFAPVGPVIETNLTPENLRVVCRVNGEIKQNGNTKDMVFDVKMLISFISHVMTLLPGDLVATGTPSGVGQLSPGDIVEVDIENIGVLRNYVHKQ